MPSPDLEADAAAFEEWRSLLFGIAYRMLGSAADAEDVVQVASIRWLRRADKEIQSVRAYLVTIVTRLCLDQFSSARSTRLADPTWARGCPSRWSSRRRRPSRRTPSRSHSSSCWRS